MSAAGQIPVHPASVAALRELESAELGPGPWHRVEQETIDEFARVTGDDQWIHVDVERARAALGGTIAHGLFTLAIGPKLMRELIAFDGFAHGLNYGYDRVRFPAPLPVGEELRLRARILEVSDAPPNGAQVRIEQTFERRGGEKPVCVAIQLARFYESAG
jgi:acyl dehydratase